MKHFNSPRNIGELKVFNGYAKEENPVCGDVVEFWTCWDNNVVTDVKFKARGCVPVIAACSVLSELAKGKKRDLLLSYDEGELWDALGGLPSNKKHAVYLAVSALKSSLVPFKVDEDASIICNRSGLKE